MNETHLLRLPYLEAAQSQKHVTHNEALSMLDIVVQLSVIQRGVVSPPVSPANGDSVIVGAGAVDQFLGHDLEVAAYQDNAWRYYVPRAGWCVFVSEENVFLIFDGLAWNDISASISSLQNLSLLGVGTTADSLNPLSAKLNAALLTALSTAEGGTDDMRLLLNKAAAGAIASHLFQSEYSARAELGLLGSDSFSIKVSPDGSAWHEALNIDPASGVVAFPAGASGIPGMSVKRIEVFTSSGTFNKLSGDAAFYVEMVGGGGGGGSGARNAAGSACGGGSGGNGGSAVLAWLTADQLGTSTIVEVGAGGAGGAAAPDNSNGSNGVVGGNSTLGSILVASGGREGVAGKATSAGTAASHLPGYPDNVFVRSGAGGYAAAGGIQSRSGFATSGTALAGAGGGGGGLSAADASFPGGAGSIGSYAWPGFRGAYPYGGAAEGGAGDAGGSIVDARGMFGGGGAGGGSAHLVNAGNGGAGGTYGGGGGGGGAGRNGLGGGAGGDGAPGKVIIVVYG